MHLISVIIPVYNTPINYLKECLRSIENSNIKYNYEIILVNDGSTDEDTVSFLNTYQEKHLFIINKENSGVSAARNTGLKNAKGDFILFLDSDDILLPEINNALNFLKKNTDYDLVYSDSLNFGDENKREIKNTFSSFKLLYLNNYLNTCCVFRKNNFLYDCPQ